MAERRRRELELAETYREVINSKGDERKKTMRGRARRTNKTIPPTFPKKTLRPRALLLERHHHHTNLGMPIVTHDESFDRKTDLKRTGWSKHHQRSTTKINRTPPTQRIHHQQYHQHDAEHQITIYHREWYEDEPTRRTRTKIQATKDGKINRQKASTKYRTSTTTSTNTKT